MIRSLLTTIILLGGCGEPQNADAKPKKSKKDTVVAAASEGAVDPSAAVVTWKGGQLTQGEMDADLHNELAAKEAEFLMGRYDRQNGWIEEKLIDSLLKLEAESRGLKDEAELLKIEIEDKTTEPSEEAIAELYEQAKRQLGGATLEQARPMVVGELQRRQNAERFGEYVKELKAKYEVDVALAYPDLPRVDVPIEDNDPTLGNADAPVTIVQYAEYQCPYCGTAAETVRDLRERYPDEVRVVYKDFPLNFHKRAVPAAVAAHCAGEQGKYWELGEIMLQHQKELEDNQLEQYATEVGLDIPSWKECTTSGKWEPIVMADLEAGQEVGVQATPTFFVNGILVSGAQPADAFAPIIDRELGR